MSRCGGGWWKGRGEVPERCRPYCCMPERIERIGEQFFSLANQVEKCLEIQNKDFVSEGPQPCKFAGIDGTDQQRAAAVKEGWGYLLLFSARLVGVFLVADALFIGAQQVACVFRI
ncbi:hypothetical protein NC652_029785 [Populus alba x Populus x berolinensis]|nr:hypothetical protein NC652_029785 [Populus alba x Populus x berolinensis]